MGLINTSACQVDSSLFHPDPTLVDGFPLQQHLLVQQWRHHRVHQWRANVLEAPTRRRSMSKSLEAWVDDQALPPVSDKFRRAFFGVTPRMRSTNTWNSTAPRPRTRPEDCQAVECGLLPQRPESRRHLPGDW